MTASFLQGAVTGALVATGGYFVTVSGGRPRGVEHDTLAVGDEPHGFVDQLAVGAFGDA